MNMEPCFTCRSCAKGCLGSGVGFQAADNRHLVELDNIDVSITNSFPIFDMNGNCHNVYLRNDIVSRIVAPKFYHSTFRGLRIAFFDKVSEEDWWEFDTKRLGVKFEFVDNIHLLNGKLDGYLPIFQKGEGTEEWEEHCRASANIELMGIHNGIKRSYRYFVRRSVLENHFSRKHTADEIHWISRKRNEMLRATLGSDFPPFTNHHSWSLSEQRDLFRLLERETQARSSLNQALQNVAHRFRQIPNHQETETWSIFEFFLRIANRTAVEAETLPQQDETETNFELPNMKRAISDVMRYFPDWGLAGRPGSFAQFLRVVGYRIYCLGSYTETPLTFRRWISAWHATGLTDLDRIMRPPIQDYSGCAGPRWNGRLHLEPLKAACEACLNDGATIFQIYQSFLKIRKRQGSAHLAEKVYQLMGLAPGGPPLVRVAGYFTRSWRTWKCTDDPFVQYLSQKQQAEGIVLSRAPRRKRQMLKLRYSPPTQLIAPDPPRKRPSSDLAAWVDGLDWDGIARKAASERNHAKATLEKYPSLTQRILTHRLFTNADAELLSKHLAQTLEIYGKAGFSLLDPRWQLLKKTGLGRQEPTLPWVIYGDVEALHSPKTRGPDESKTRIFAFHMLKADAPRCDPTCPPHMEGHLFITIDHRMTILEATIGCRPLSYTYVKKQYRTADVSQRTYGTYEADVADRLKEFGITEDKRQDGIMICYTGGRGGSSWDYRCLSALPNCRPLLPSPLDPAHLFSPLGWFPWTRLIIAFKALTRDEENPEQRQYYESLAKNHHYPWADNEMSRIVTEKLLLTYYRDA
ncbi:uncharacterized protein GGS22DRAFT_81590 [Annulohypoxylon maeteangense]|uniref:uncharacterized protein n=1 Tax=Annulohypoxylon maeteangense TaxID=1927788 RepID=UPI0020088ADA|nr:uncharacterized protein GGS22DRAFT_81590 [Annulohypoxylon maeteangense]KAI0880662.1 hypothetical protein GGS22DRAFT_81590 [Annulohypoxylon maeteangense]